MSWWWRGWWWDYPATKAGKWLVLLGAVIITLSLDPIVIYEWEPDYYRTVGGLTLVGTGCAMLAYHIRAGDEEDTATKKKIILIGVAVTIPITALGILNILDML